MHAVLLATALVIGSDNGREAATDCRTVNRKPAYTELRDGMSYKEACHLVGYARSAFDINGELLLFWHLGPDEFGRVCEIIMHDKGDRGSTFEVQLTWPAAKK
jgi:hypothetical protein